ANARLEPALPGTGRVELHQVRHVVSLDRMPECPLRHALHDLARAGRLLVGAARVAAENPATAGSLAHSGGFERATHLEGAHAQHVLLPSAGHVGLEPPFGLRVTALP